MTTDDEGETRWGAVATDAVAVDLAAAPDGSRWGVVTAEGETRWGAVATTDVVALAAAAEGDPRT